MAANTTTPTPTTANNKPFNIHGAAHTGITVRSLATSLRFWHDLLGFEVRYYNHLECSAAMDPLGLPTAKLDIAMLGLPDGSMLELLEYGSPGERETYKPRPCDVGSVHLALELRGTPALIDAAAALGWRAVNAPQPLRRGDGSRWTVVYMHGPDGETVELMEKLDE